MHLFIQHLLSIHPLSVFYWRVRSYQTLSSVEQHKFITAQHVGQESGHGTTDFSARGLTGQKKRCQPELQAWSGSQGALLSSVALGRIHFLVAGGLRSPLSC